MYFRCRGGVRCLGHIVGSGHIKPDPDNVSGILELPVPRDATMVPSIISAVGYYRDYIQNFALITSLMAQLLKKMMSGCGQRIARSHLRN